MCYNEYIKREEIKTMSIKGFYRVVSKKVDSFTSADLYLVNEGYKLIRLKSNCHVWKKESIVIKLYK